VLLVCDNSVHLLGLFGTSVISAKIVQLRIYMVRDHSFPWQIFPNSTV